MRLSSDTKESNEHGIKVSRPRGRMLDLAVWHERIKGLDLELIEAKQTAWNTEELLATQGWCLWRCNVLGNDTIAIISDSVEGYIPEGYITYTEDELRRLFGDGYSLDPAMLRLIHEAKKFGAKVLGKVPYGQISWSSAN